MVRLIGLRYSCSQKLTVLQPSCNRKAFDAHKTIFDAHNKQPSGALHNKL